MTLKISKSDRIIIIVFCLISLGAFLVLYYDLFANSDRISNQPVIAQAIEVSNDVRIKQKEQFDWSKSSINNLIHYGDQIFSGANSQVIIQLNDGQRMKISQNSLIKFEEKQGVKNLKIMFGSLSTQVKKDELIEVVICGQIHKIRSTSDDEMLISNNNNCEAPQIKLKKNPTVANYIPKKKQQDKVLAKLNLLLAKKDPVLLDAPVIVNPTIFMKASESTKRLEWQYVLNALYYRVIFFESQNTDNVIKKFDTKDNFLDFQPTAEYNEYTYKVEAIGDAKNFLSNTSDPGTLQMVYPEIKVAAPIKKIVMQARTSDQKAKAVDEQIQWIKTPRASSYQVEFSDDPSFDKIIDVKKTTTNSLKFKVNDFGKVYYRIKSFSAKGKDLSKSQDESYVEYIKNHDLQPPQINHKSKTQTLFFQKTEGQFIKLSWENLQIEKASDYYIEISESEDFSKIIRSYKTNKLSISIKGKLSQGKYYWRVKSFNSEMVSDWSEVAELKIFSLRTAASEGESN